MAANATLDPSASVNDTLVRHPETVAVFNEFGIDTCCGGHEPITVAAEHAGADIARLLEALRRAVEQSA